MGAFIAFFLVGCYPASVKHQWGWTTYQITGKIRDISGLPITHNGFVVAQSYYSDFIEMGEGGSLYAPKASLIFPDAHGEFVVPFDLSASKIQLMVIADGFQSQSLFFQRQLGVGDLHYTATMLSSAEWSSYFLLSISPFLQRFILDERYGLAKNHQLFLTDWLETQRKKIETPTTKLL